MSNYFLVPLQHERQPETLKELDGRMSALLEQMRALTPPPGSISGRNYWETATLPAVMDGPIPADPVTAAFEDAAPTHHGLGVGMAAVLPKAANSMQARAPRAEDVVGYDDPIVARLLAVGARIKAENQRIERDKWRFRLRLAVGTTSVGGAILAVGAWFHYYN